MRKKALTALLVAMVVTAGCSALTDQSTTETPDTPGTFSETVLLPTGGVAGEESVVRIELNNTADSERQYEATLTADGTQVASDSVTVAPGEATTLSLGHTFEETGEHTLSVGNRTTTITVHEDPQAFITTQMGSVESVRIEEQATFDGTINTFSGPVDAEATSSATIVKNFRTERLYKRGMTEITADGETTTEQTEEWVVGTRRYTKTVDGDGTAEYEREFSEEFDDDTDTEIDDEDVEPYLRTDHTDQEYVYIAEGNSSAEATALWERIDDNEESISAESLTYLRLELRFDRQTGRQTTQVARLEGEGGDEFATLDMRITREFVAYGEEVTVEVPSTVREQAS